MKKILILFSFILFGGFLMAQNQEINGSLTTAGDIQVGKHIAGKWGEGTRLYLQGTDPSNDPVWMAKYTAKHEYTDLRVNVGDGVSPGDRFVVGTTVWNNQKWCDFFVVRMDGNVGIGVAQPTSKLDVNGTIRAKEVKIEATGWADFVFAPDYKLPPLSEVKKYIADKQHLPNIPSEAEVKKNGVDVGEMQMKLLQKIEELTLYVIELKEENVAFKEELNILKNK